MNINEIIRNEDILIKYQPIMSAHNRFFLGVEALMRGISADGEISPFDMFREADIMDCVLELDQLCIRKSVQGFIQFYKRHPQTVLFINIDASVIDYYNETNYIIDTVNRSGIKPSNIVLEINELPTETLIGMKSFAEKHTEYGFMIAIDDIGAGSSNLDRIPMIMPNIMKIDKELIQGLHKSFYKQQVVSMIIQLATNLGALIVVEGIESIDDVKQISEFGTLLIQGYFLGKPELLSEKFYANTQMKIDKIILLMNNYACDKSKQLKEVNMHMKEIHEKIIAQLTQVSLDKLSDEIAYFINHCETIESAYVIDYNGKMITETIFNMYSDYDETNMLYTPFQIGDFVQLEDYYTKIAYEEYNFWISKEYISMATGNKCYTLSSHFENVYQERFILCIDFNSKKIKEKTNEPLTLLSYDSRKVNFV